MVTTKIFARCGNNIFQIVAAIAYAMKYNLPWHIPDHTENERFFPKHFTWLTNPDYNFNYPILQIVEKQHNFYELPDPDELLKSNVFYNNHAVNNIDGFNVVLQGYFQSELYFKEYWEQIRPLLKFMWKPVQRIVSLHVRRGDYVTYKTKHPPVDDNYLSKAMEYFYINKGVSVFMCFSDDINWVKQHINRHFYPNYTFIYSDNNSPLSDIEQMSECSVGNIIANSTFSWWGAYLNQNPNKIVVSPSTENWFGPDNKHTSAETIIPKDWVQIKY